MTDQNPRGLFNESLSPGMMDTSDDELPASASPEGVQQFERMFADAVDVREELEEALGEFMLMGDKAKEVLEEELLKYEAMQDSADNALTGDAAQAYMEQLNGYKATIEQVRSERALIDEQLEHKEMEAEAARAQASHAQKQVQELANQLNKQEREFRAATERATLERAKLESRVSSNTTAIFRPFKTGAAGVGSLVETGVLGGFLRVLMMSVLPSLSTCATSCSRNSNASAQCFIRLKVDSTLENLPQLCLVQLGLRRTSRPRPGRSVSWDPRLKENLVALWTMQKTCALS